MNQIKKDFPIFERRINDMPIYYLDSAATTQKPQYMLDQLKIFFTQNNATVYRGIYTLAEEATAWFERVRGLVAQFINAHPEEIVFTRNTTESINMIAATWGEQHIGHGDTIVISELEHHSNMLPWQRLAQKKGAQLIYIPVNHEGVIDEQTLDQYIPSTTKLISISHVSNAVGVTNNIDLLVQHARRVGAKICIDAAQSVGHQPLDVQKIDCDFLVFSSHKMFGPTGAGVAYVNKKLHAQMPPYQLGGGMVQDVDFYEARWLPFPHKMEAGTPAVAQAVGLGAAIEYIQQSVNLTQLQAYEAGLTAQLIEGLEKVPRIRLLGPLGQLKKQGHMVSFIVDGMHAHDVAAYLNTVNICVRAGHHCAQPLAQRLGLDASVRVSFHAYNDESDVTFLLKTLSQLPLL